MTRVTVEGIDLTTIDLHQSEPGVLDASLDSQKVSLTLGDQTVLQIHDDPHGVTIDVRHPDSSFTFSIMPGDLLQALWVATRDQGRAG